MNIEVMTKHTINILLVFLLLPISGGYAQNLVINPSFEDYEICPEEEMQFSGYVSGWETFFTTPDYINVCGYYPPLIQSMASTPRTGDGLAGCFWYKTINSTNIFREYIHGQLTEPMESGELYYAEFYIVNHADGYAINNYQIHFSNNQIDAVPSDGILYLMPHISNQNGLINSNDWVKISGCYTAQGGERHIILGNFMSNEETDTMQLNPLAASNYNIIDDVSVYKLSTLIPNDTTIIEGGNIALPSLVDQMYYLDGEQLAETVYYPPSTGVYEIEVELADCGIIGSFLVEVLACTERAETFESPLPAYSEVCVEDMPVINLPAHDCCDYYLSDLLIEEEAIVFSNPGFYEIEVRVIDCSDLETYIVEVIACDDGVLSAQNCFYFPNVFSPNYDGMNDEFRLYGTCEISSYRLEIFNRWGGTLFSTTEPTEGWTGERKGKSLESGVYIYTALIEYQGQGGRVYSTRLSGDITLLR